MASINKVILVGNLGKDPELRQTQNGNSVASFRIATTEYFGDKEKRTEWHNIVVWGKQAENADKYLSRGKSVYVEGRITTRSWVDKEGNKRYKTEIVAQNIQFLGGKDVSGEPNEEKPKAEPEPIVDDELPF